MKSQIIVTAQFIAFHCWPDAPDEVAFLRQLHRHVFHVKLGIPVDDNDRQREFFIEQKRLSQALDGLPRYSAMSCEQMATEILCARPHAVWCEVWEDNENGARVER